MKTVVTKSVGLVAATSPYTIEITSDTEVITFYGDKTLWADFVIQASTTPANYCTVTMIFTGQPTIHTYTISIFGFSIPQDIIVNPFIAICHYANDAWSVGCFNLTGVLPVFSSGGLGVNDTTGGMEIAAGGIINAMVNAAAAIAYSKLALTDSIVNADINAAAAIAYTKLALTGAILNADINAAAAIAYSKLALTGGIVNADINAAAAIAHSKMAALTASKLLQSDGSGVVSVVDTGTYPSLTELAYVKGVTSALQAQINAKASTTYVDAADAVLTAAISAINPSIKTKTTVTGTTVLTAATIKNNILCDTTGGGFTTDLPLISTMTNGYEVTLTCIGHISNVATVAANASDKILDETNTLVTHVDMAGYGKSYTLQANTATSEWQFISKIA